MAALLGVAVVLLLWGAAPAWAVARVTIDPARDVVDGQVVEVSGTGYAPNFSYGMVLCESVRRRCCDLPGLHLRPGERQ